jgi:diguanylate cyclase (GGDEF)-like protein/PAS domain S-box-containing protein
MSLADRYAWLEAMINHVPDYIYAKDLEGRFLFANQAVVGNNGLKTVADIVGLTDLELHGPAAATGIAEIEQRVMETGEPDLGYEERAMRGGHDRWLMMSRVPLRDKSGNVIGVVGASRDITARKASERLMKAQARLLEMIVQSVAIPSFVTELALLLQGLSFGTRAAVFLKRPGDGRFMVAAAPSLAAPQWTLVEDVVAASLLQDDRDTFAAATPAILAGLFGPDAAGPCLQIPCADGSCHGFLALSVHDHQFDAAFGEFAVSAARMAGIAIDGRRAEERIRYLAQHDALTGLPNRTLLDGQLELMLAGAQAASREVAIGFLDLDNFKLVNDSLGHRIGDLLLQAVAERLSESVGADGLVARIGGDEFILVLPQAQESFADRLQHIRTRLAEPFVLEEVELRTTCSIGVACFPLHGRSTSHLFANADMAMYRVKEKGRDGIEIFSEEMADKARRRFMRSEELRRALERDEFVLHFQPQKDLVTGRITGVEALVRWQHPRDGLIAPGSFIPLAEETGLIVEIGALVLRKACRQAKAWQDEGLVPIKMGVNMSARQFQEPGLTRQVAAALAEAGLDPQWLEIEITESLIMRDVQASVTRMKELTALGVSLALDDFGTGYSSLSMLKGFPLSRLKIDRSFIADIPGDADDMAITSAIISLAQKLGLAVMAEGVETEAQAAFLLEAGCRDIQGYLFSRPLPAGKLAALLRGCRAARHADQA